MVTDAFSLPLNIPWSIAIGTVIVEVRSILKGKPFWSIKWVKRNANRAPYVLARWSFLSSIWGSFWFLFRFSDFFFCLFLGLLPRFCCFSRAFSVSFLLLIKNLQFIKKKKKNNDKNNVVNNVVRVDALKVPGDICTAKQLKKVFIWSRIWTRLIGSIVSLTRFWTYCYMGSKSNPTTRLRRGPWPLIMNYNHDHTLKNASF